MWQKKTLCQCSADCLKASDKDQIESVVWRNNWADRKEVAEGETVKEIQIFESSSAKGFDKALSSPAIPYKILFCDIGSEAQAWMVPEHSTRTGLHLMDLCFA